MARTGVACLHHDLGTVPQTEQPRVMNAAAGQRLNFDNFTEAG